MKQRYSGPERVGGRRWEAFGAFGHEDAAAEGGMDVSEVVLQRRDLLCVLLRGEDLRGELSQLRKPKNRSVGGEAPGRAGTDQPVTRRCGRGPRRESRPLPGSREEW